MNDLVKRLSEKVHAVQANRPDTSAKSLKERIDLNYVHILFQETGTEIGMQLDTEKCELASADFTNGTGKIHLEGALTLNYDKVRCVADINLDTMHGTGYLKLIESDSEYSKIIRSEAAV